MMVVEKSEEFLVIETSEYFVRGKEFRGKGK